MRDVEATKIHLIILVHSCKLISDGWEENFYLLNINHIVKNPSCIAFFTW